VHVTAAMEAELAASGSRPVVIPYRRNRVVVFDSALYHATNRHSFKPGYTNRRINLTLLFGLPKPPPANSTSPTQPTPPTPPGKVNSRGGD